MPDFSKRTLLPEKMDQPGVPDLEIRQALRELEIINKVLGGYHLIFNALEQLPINKKPVTIIDLGCGGGDMLRAISKWAKKKSKEVKLIGVDWNPVMTNFATEQAKNYLNIRFIAMNVFDSALENERADIVMNSLFCHHFANDELIHLVKKMYSLASQAVIVNDLHRHWFAYYSIKVITMLFSKTYLVKYDGPLSVARSLNRSEWEHVLHSAGIKNYSLRWMWAWRWQLIIRK